MANRIGGRPYKKRLLPGVGYPIPISPAAAPSGGFASPVLLWPYGFGAAASGLTLTQSGAVAATGALAIAGDLSFVAPFTLAQTGAIGLAGAAALSGDLTYVAPAVLTQSGAIAITGVPTLSGDLGITAQIVFM